MAKAPPLGSKIRRLRNAEGFSQVEAANRLGISASYLNLIEHNQRPLTVPLLFKIGQLFDVDLRDWSEGDEARLATTLREVLDDPVLRQTDVNDAEINETVSAAPNICMAVSELYAAYRRALDTIHMLGDRLSEQAIMSSASLEMRSVLTSIRSFSEILREHQDIDEDQRKQFLSILVDESNRLASVIDAAAQAADREQPDSAMVRRQSVDMISRFLERQNNHFPALEARADDISGAWTGGPFELPTNLAAALRDRSGISVSFADGTETTRTGASPGGITVRTDQPAVSGCMELGRLLGQHECQDIIESILESGGAESSTELEALRAVLTDYFAAALILPYSIFHAAAEATAYDLDALSRRFQVSPLRVARRLTNLRQTGAAGIAFHLLVVDVAGNVRERITGSGMPLPRFGSACPKWALHRAFSQPGELIAQMAEFPDGAAYFNLSGIDRSQGNGTTENLSELAFTIGCSADQAGRLKAYEDLSLGNRQAPVAVGVNCRVCPRTDCTERAFSSILNTSTETVIPSPTVQ